MSQRSVQRWFNPEAALGGFAHNDHRVIFFNRVNALLTPDMTVMDLGAGRGAAADAITGYRGELGALKGKCRKLIGADVDPVVLQNPMVDTAVVIDADGRIDLPDDSVDLVFSCWTLEHVADPEVFAAELDRIIKPGGYLCAFTPNRWSYFAIGARLLPHSLHYPLVRRLGPGLRKEKDVFPTVYRMNTLSAIRRWFPAGKYENFSYLCSGPPAYHAGILPLAMVWAVWQWLLPRRFAQMLHVFLRKRAMDSKPAADCSTQSTSNAPAIP